jgi:hypothetical protein
MKDRGPPIVLILESLRLLAPMVVQLSCIGRKSNEKRKEPKRKERNGKEKKKEKKRFISFVLPE